MSHQFKLDQWTQVLANKFPNLSKPQARVLAMYSFGMILAQSSGLSKVVTIMALLLDQNANSLRQRLKEWYLEARRKRGKKRVTIDVTTCFGPLLRWILSLWTAKYLFLAIDATNISNRLTVLSVSVCYRGSALPVAWTIFKADATGSWHDHWVRMLKTLREAVPDEMQVLVTSDRGISSSRLFRAIVDLGWHPFLRVKKAGTFRSKGSKKFRQLTTFAKELGSSYARRGQMFKTASARINCTLLAMWEAECEEAWFIITDLSPGEARAKWYGTRFWIEHSFKQLKSGWWKWQQTRQEYGARAERQWLAIAVATVWLSGLGTIADGLPEGTFLDNPPSPDDKRSLSGTRLRSISILRKGFAIFLVRLLRGGDFFTIQLIPDLRDPPRSPRNLLSLLLAQ